MSTAVNAGTARDLRSNLYPQYVSTFKGEQKGERSWCEWAKIKYLPLLSGIPKTASILELGCGPGWMLRLLADNGFQDVEGIDISTEQVDLATRMVGCKAKVADAVEFLEKSQKEYDVILAIDFIEHFTKDELFSMLSVMASRMRAKGKLILQTPNGEGMFPRQVIYGDLTHMAIYTPGSLGQALKVSGFDGVSFFETGPTNKNIQGIIRLVVWKALKQFANAIRIVETGKRQTVWTENMICVAHKV